jgi:hypothetical protein
MDNEPKTPPADLSAMTDDELLAAWKRTDGGSSRADAIVDEMERRGWNIRPIQLRPRSFPHAREDAETARLVPLAPKGPEPK